LIEVRGERVLLVEDDPDTREVLAYALASEGFVVIVAPDGERGLEVARAWRPDVVLLDVLMPRVSGNEMAAAMRRDPALHGIPIVSMSASPAELGPPAARAHVSKPFALSEVARALRDALVPDATALARALGAPSSQR
jgi:two-component system phosphate regulon response regulator PhoB